MPQVRWPRPTDTRTRSSGGAAVAATLSSTHRTFMMSEKREGFSVSVTINCYDPEGKQLTDGPVQWFGFESEYSMNKFANGATAAIVQFLAAANEEKYGKGKPPHAG